MSQPRLTDRKFITVFIFATTLFLMWGLLHSMSDSLNKDFQDILKISKLQSGYVQFSVFGAYFVMSVPAGYFLRKFGYKPGILLGLGLFAAGTFLFIPAANTASFTFFRIALFIIGCGMATLETVAHPFAAALGDQRSSDRRLNFAQSFNAIGTIIGPAIASQFLFNKEGDHVAGLEPVKVLYAGIGFVILVIAMLFALIKIPSLSEIHHVPVTATDESFNIDTAPRKKLIHHRHFVCAAIAQFFNVAAQAGTWAFFINYGTDIMGYSKFDAVRNMSIFMLMMAIGRFVGTYLMKFVEPQKLLAGFAAGSVLMCIIVAQKFGMVSYIALMMINFFFSIMFPTIYSLGLKNLGSQTEQASSFIAMGVVGGAVFPLLMGTVANHDVAKAYYLPIICYFVIFLFGLKFFKVQHVTGKADEKEK